MSSLSSAGLARSGALSLLGSAVAAAMGLLLVVVLGRLGDEGAGFVLQTIAVFAITLAIARLGADSAAIWALPQDSHDRNGLVAPIARRLLLAGLGGGVVVAALWYATTAALHLGGAWDASLAHAMYATAWALPFAAVLAIALAINRGLAGVAAYVVIGNLLVPTLRPLLVLAVVLGGLGAIGASVAWAIPPALACGLALALAVRAIRRIEPRASTDRAAIARRWGSVRRYAAPRVISATLEQALQWVGVIIVGVLATAGDAGVYGAASRVIAALLIVDAALRVVVSPEFSRLLHVGDLQALRRLYVTATSWLVLFSTPIALLLIVFAPVVLGVIGDDFVEGSMVIAVLGGGTIVTLMAGNVHSVLLMSGRSSLAAINKVTALCVNVGLMVWWIPEFGIVGAALAWTVGMVLDAGLATAQVWLLIGFPVPLAAGLYPLLIAGVTVAGPALAARWWFGETWTALVIGTAGAAIAFGAWCLLDRRQLFGAGIRSTAA